MLTIWYSCTQYYLVEETFDKRLSVFHRWQKWIFIKLHTLQSIHTRCKIIITIELQKQHAFNSVNLTILSQFAKLNSTYVFIFTQ